MTRPMSGLCEKLSKIVKFLLLRFDKTSWSNISRHLSTALIKGGLKDPSGVGLREAQLCEP